MSTLTTLFWNGKPEGNWVCREEVVQHQFWKQITPPSWLLIPIHSFIHSETFPGTYYVKVFLGLGIVKWKRSCLVINSSLVEDAEIQTDNWNSRGSIRKQHLIKRVWVVKIDTNPASITSWLHDLRWVIWPFQVLVSYDEGKSNISFKMLLYWI